MPLPCEIVPITRVQERPHSGKITFGKNGVEGTRIWDVPWYDASTGRDYVSFITTLLGYTISGPYLTPQITRPDVFSAQFPWLYCQDCSVEGEDQNGVDGWGRIQFQRAIITAKYMPYEMGESFNLASSLLSFRENNFSWVGPYVPPPAPPPIPLPPENNPAEQVNLQNQIAALQTYLTQLTNQLQADQTLIDAWTALGQSLLPGWQDPVSQFFANDIAIYTVNNPQDLAPADLANFVNALNTANTGIVTIPGQIQNAQAQLNTIELQLADAQNLQGQVQAQRQQYLADLATWQAAALQYLYLPGVSDAQYQAKQTGSVSTSVGKIIPLGEYTIERHHMMVPDFGLYISMLGCVNADYFLGFPMWTLLFHGIDGKRTILPNGTRCWDVTLKFLFNPNGHNMLYRPEKGHWEVIVSQQTSALRDLWLSSIALATGKIIVDTSGGNIDFNSLYHNYLYTPVDYSVFLVYA